MVRAKYPGAYDDLDDASLDRMVRQKYPGAYDDIPDKPETKDEAALRLANSRFTVNPDLDAWKRRGGAFVDRGVEMAKGLGSLGLDAAKSALTLEGQVGFLPRMAKNAYEGMIDSSAEAINRQTSPERKGLAAVPVIGPYAMNVLSDYEEGKGPEAEGRMAFDVLSMLVPGSKAGRGATGAAIRLADGKIMKPITKGLKPLVKRGAEMGVEMAPEAIGAVAGGALGGPTGAAAGALSGKALKDAYRAVKEGGKTAEAAPSAPVPRPKATAEQIKAAVEAGPRGNAAKKLMREAKEAKTAKAAEAQAKKDAGKAKFEAAKEAAKPKAEAPAADKPPTVTVPGETGPRVVSEPSPTSRAGSGDVAREWVQKYAAADIEGRRALVKGLSGKLTYEDMRQLAAYTDDLTDAPGAPPKAVESNFRPAKLEDVRPDPKPPVEKTPAQVKFEEAKAKAAEAIPVPVSESLLPTIASPATRPMLRLKMKAKAQKPVVLHSGLRPGEALDANQVQIADANASALVQDIGTPKGVDLIQFLSPGKVGGKQTRGILNAEAFKRMFGLSHKELDPKHAGILTKGGETDFSRLVDSPDSPLVAAGYISETGLAGLQEFERKIQLSLAGVRQFANGEGASMIPESLSGELGITPAKIKKALADDKGNPTELKVRKHLAEKDPYDVERQMPEVSDAQEIPGFVDSGPNPWDDPVELPKGKSAAQAAFEKAKGDRMLKRIEEASSPNAALRDLKLAGIPSKDARAMIDMVWKEKDPTYQSIEQWMDARKEKWNKMRHKKGTP